MYFFALINLILFLVSCEVIRPSAERKEKVELENPSVSPVLEDSGSPLVFYGVGDSSAPSITPNTLSLYGERLLLQDARGDYSFFWEESPGKWLALASQKPSGGQPWYSLAGMPGSPKKSPVAILSLNRQYGVQNFRLGSHEFSVDRRARLIVQSGNSRFLFLKEMPKDSAFDVYGILRRDIKEVNWFSDDKLPSSNDFSAQQEPGSYRLELVYQQGEKELTFQYPVKVIQAASLPDVPTTIPILALQYSYTDDEAIYPLNFNRLTSSAQPLAKTLRVRPFSMFDAHLWRADINLLDSEGSGITVDKRGDGTWDLSSLQANRKYSFQFSEEGGSAAFDFTTAAPEKTVQTPYYCVLSGELCAKRPLNSEETLYLSSLKTYRFFFGDVEDEVPLWWWNDENSGSLTTYTGKEIELSKPSTGSYLLTLLTQDSSLHRAFPVIVDGMSDVVINFSQDNGEPLTAFEVFGESTKTVVATAKTYLGLRIPSYIDWVDQKAGFRDHYSDSYQLWLGGTDGRKLGSWNDSLKGYDNKLEINEAGKYRVCATVLLTETVCSEPFYRLKFSMGNVAQEDGDVPKLVFDAEPLFESLNYRWVSRLRNDEIIVGVGKELAVPLGEYEGLGVEVWASGLPENRIFYEQKDFVNIYDVAIGGNSLLDGNIFQALDFLGQKSFKLRVSFFDLAEDSQVKWVRVKLVKESAYLSLEENQQTGQGRKSLTLSPFEIEDQLDKNFYTELYFRWNFESDYDNNQIQVELLDEKQKPLQRRFFTVLASNTPPPSPQLCLGVNSCKDQEAIKLVPEEEIEIYDVPSLFAVDDLESEIVYGHARYLQGYKISYNDPLNEEEILWDEDSYQAVALPRPFASGDDRVTLQLTPQIIRNNQPVRLPSISYFLKRRSQPELELNSPYSEAGLWYTAPHAQPRRLSPKKAEFVQLAGKFSLVIYDPASKVEAAPSLTFSNLSITPTENKEETSLPWRRWDFTLAEFPDAQFHDLVTGISWEDGKNDSRAYSLAAQQDVTLAKETYGVHDDANIGELFTLKDKVYWGLQPFRFEFNDPNKLIKSVSVEEKENINFDDRDDSSCKLEQIQNENTTNPVFCADFQLRKDEDARFTLLAKDAAGSEVFRKRYQLSSLWSDATWWVSSADKRLDAEKSRLKISDVLSFAGEVGFPNLDDSLRPKLQSEGAGEGYVIEWCYLNTDGTYFNNNGSCDSYKEDEDYVLAKNAGKRLAIKIAYVDGSITRFSREIRFAETIQHLAKISYDKDFWVLESKGDAAVVEYKGETGKPYLISGSLENGQELLFDENGLNDIQMPGTLEYTLSQGASDSKATQIADSWSREGWALSDQPSWKQLSNDWIGGKLFFKVEYKTLDDNVVKLLLSSRATIARRDNKPVWSILSSELDLKEGEKLQLSLIDADMDKNGATYRWLRYDGQTNNSPEGGAVPRYDSSSLWKEIHIGDTYTLRQADVAHFIVVEASYTEHDGKKELAYRYFNKKVENVNNKPSGEIRGLLPTDEAGVSKARQLDTLKLVFSDDDGYSENVRYRWSRTIGTRRVSVGDSAEYTVQQDDVGRTLTVEVNYTDKFDKNERFSASVEIIENVFPSVQIKVEDTSRTDVFIERKSNKVSLLAGQTYEFSFDTENVESEHSGIEYDWTLDGKQNITSEESRFQHMFSEEGDYNLNLTFREGSATKTEKLEIKVLNFSWQGGNAEEDWIFTSEDQPDAENRENLSSSINGLENKISVGSPFEGVQHLAFNVDYLSVSSGSDNFITVGKDYWTLTDSNTASRVENSINLNNRVGEAKLQFLRKGSYRVRVDLLKGEDRLRDILATRYLYLTVKAGNQDILILSDSATSKPNNSTFESFVNSYNKKYLEDVELQNYLSRSPYTKPSLLQVYGYDNSFTLYLPQSYAGKSYQFFEAEDTLARSLLKPKGVFEIENGLVRLPLNFRSLKTPTGAYGLTLQIYDQKSEGQPSFLMTRIPFNIRWLNEVEVGFAELDNDGERTGNIAEGTSSATDRLQFKIVSSDESDVEWRYRLKRGEQELVYVQSWENGSWSLLNNLGFVSLESSLPAGKFFVQAQAVKGGEVVAMSGWTQLEYISTQPSLTFLISNINLNRDNRDEDIVLVFDQEVSIETFFYGNSPSGLSLSFPLAIDENGILIGEQRSKYHRFALGYRGGQQLSSNELNLNLIVTNRTSQESSITGSLNVKIDTLVPRLTAVKPTSDDVELASGAYLAIGKELKVKVKASEAVNFHVKNDNSDRELIIEEEEGEENSYSLSYTVTEGDRTTSDFKIRGYIEDTAGNKEDINLSIPVKIDASRPKLEQVTISEEYFEEQRQEATFKLFFSEPVKSIDLDDLEEILLFNSNNTGVQLGTLFDLGSITEESNGEIISFTMRLKDGPSGQSFTSLQIPPFQDLAGNLADSAFQSRWSIPLNIAQRPTVQQPSTTRIYWPNAFYDRDKNEFYTNKDWTPQFLTASGVTKVEYCLGENCFDGSTTANIKTASDPDGFMPSGAEELSFNDERAYDFYYRDKTMTDGAAQVSIVYDKTTPVRNIKFKTSDIMNSVTYYPLKPVDEWELEFVDNNQVEPAFYRYQLDRGEEFATGVWKSFLDKEGLESNPSLKLSTKGYLGQYRLSLQVTDRAGNEAIETYLLDFEDQPPLVTKTEFSKTFEAEKVTVTFSERLRESSAAVTLRDGKTLNGIVGTQDTENANVYIFEPPFVGDDSGRSNDDFTFNLNFQDLAGNSNSYQEIFSFDHRAPEIQVRKMRLQIGGVCVGDDINPASSSDTIRIGSGGLCLDFNVNLKSTYSIQASTFTLKEGDTIIQDGETLEPDKIYTFLWSPSSSSPSTPTLPAGSLLSGETGRPSAAVEWNVSLQGNFPDLTPSFKSLGGNIFQWVLRFASPVKLKSQKSYDWLGRDDIKQEIITAHRGGSAETYYYRFSLAGKHPGSLTLNIPAEGFRDLFGNPITPFELKESGLPASAIELEAIKEDLSLHFYNREEQIKLKFNRSIERFLLGSDQVNFSSPAATTDDCNGSFCYLTTLTAKDGHSGKIAVSVGVTDRFGRFRRFEKEVGTIDTKKTQLTFEEVNFIASDSSSTPAIEPKLELVFQLLDRGAKVKFDTGVNWIQFADLLKDGAAIELSEKSSAEDDTKKYTLTFPLKENIINKTLKRFYFPSGFFKYQPDSDDPSNSHIHGGSNIIFKTLSVTKDIEIDTSLDEPEVENEQRQLNPSGREIVFSVIFDEPVALSNLAIDPTTSNPVKFTNVTNNEQRVHSLKLSLPSTLDFADYTTLLSFIPSFIATDAAANKRKVTLNGWEFEPRKTAPPSIEIVGTNDANTFNLQGKKFVVAKVWGQNKAKPLILSGTASKVTPSSVTTIESFNKIFSGGSEQSLLIPIGTDGEDYRLELRFTDSAGNVSDSKIEDFSVDLTVPTLNLEKNSLKINKTTLAEASKGKHPQLDLRASEKIEIDDFDIKLSDSLVSLVEPKVSFVTFNNQYIYSLKLTLKPEADERELTGYLELGYKDKSQNQGERKLLLIDIDTKQPKALESSSYSYDLSPDYLDLFFKFNESVVPLKSEDLLVEKENDGQFIETNEGRFEFLQKENSNVQQLRYHLPRKEGLLRFSLKQAYDLAGNLLKKENIPSFGVPYDLKKPKFLGSIFPAEKTNAAFDFFLAFNEEIAEQVPLTVTEGTIKKGERGVLPSQVFEQEGVDAEAVWYRYSYASEQEKDGTVVFSLLPYSDLSKNTSRENSGVLKTIFVDVTLPSLNFSELAGNDQFLIKGEERKLLFNFSEEVKSIMFEGDVSVVSGKPVRTSKGISYAYSYTPPENAKGQTDIKVVSFEDLSGNKTEINQNEGITLFYDTELPKLERIEFTSATSEAQTQSITFDDALSKDGKVQEFFLDFIFDERVVDPGYDINFSGGFLKKYQADIEELKNNNNEREYRYRYTYVPYLNVEKQEVSFSLNRFSDFFTYEETDYVANTVSPSLSIQPSLVWNLTIDTQAPTPPVIKNFFSTKEEIIESGSSTKEEFLGLIVDVGQPQNGVLHLKNITTEESVTKALTVAEGSSIKFENLQQKPNNIIRQTQTNTYQAWIVDEAGNASSESEVVTVYFDAERSGPPRVESFKNGILTLSNYKLNDTLYYNIGGESGEGKAGPSVEILTLPQRDYRSNDVELWYVDAAGNVGESSFWPSEEQAVDAISARFLDSESPYITVAKQRDRNANGYFFAPMYVVVDREKEWEYSFDAGKTWQIGNKEGFFNVPAIDGGFLPSYVQIRQGNSLWANPEPILVLEWAVVRIAVSWDTFADLDAHLYVPEPDLSQTRNIGYENPVNRSNNRIDSLDRLAQQDRNELHFYGPEIFSIGDLFENASYFLLVEANNNSWDFDYQQTNSGSSRAQEEYERLGGSDGQWRFKKSEIEKYGTLAQVYVSFQLTQGRRLSKLFKVPYPMVYHSSDKACDNIIYGQDAPLSVGANWQEERLKNNTFAIPDNRQKREWRALSFKVEGLNSEGQITSIDNLKIADNWSDLSNDIDLSVATIRGCEQ